MYGGPHPHPGQCRAKSGVYRRRVGRQSTCKDIPQITVGPLSLNLNDVIGTLHYKNLGFIVRLMDL